ncbi:hypothetical protein [Thermoanaerobacter uzonensis]|uniref:hypothetical protein n=1 Tax=Thermoanaerobacter uzonensis TaxID=447593 RepID=UPI003D76679C
MRIRDCNYLEECDRYFEDVLSLSKNKEILGYIELDPDEIDHMAGLISKELVKPDFNISESLAISVFLVWVGILYYQEGNFWTPVYKMLRLPSQQVSWQRRLGEIFLKTVKKYGLLDFKDELRYIMPILAHGCVPNFYLRDYFSNVVFRIYGDRQELELSITLDEVRHIVSAWRKEYQLYMAKEKKLKELDKKEKELQIAFDVLKNKNRLLRLRELLKGLKRVPELKVLLSKPEGWLDESRKEKEKLNAQLNEIRDVLEKKEIFEKEYEEVEKRIRDIAYSFLSYWSDDLAEVVVQLSIDEIENNFTTYWNFKKRYGGLFGVLMRFIIPAGYYKMLNSGSRLKANLEKLPLKENLLENYSFEIIRYIKELQELLRRRKNLMKEIEEEAAATTYEKISKEILEDIERRLFELEGEINFYEQNLKVVGKGKVEEGLEILEEQRRLRLEIKEVKKGIESEYPLETLWQNFSLIWKYADEEEVKNLLTEVQDKKKEYADGFGKLNNPLYFLNESTRLFIFQGGEIAEDFVFQSLVYVGMLERGEEAEDVRLPKRIKNELKRWWEEEGKEKLTVEREKNRRTRDEKDLILRKPFIKLDTVERVIKVEMPKQILSNGNHLVFRIKEDNMEVKDIKVAIKKFGNEYQTEIISEVLEKPREFYHFELRQEDKVVEWDITGIWHNRCLLFSVEKKLLESLYLPEEGVYIVTAYGSKISPSLAVRERGRLIGEWSDYEYIYVDLGDIEMFSIEVEGEEFVFKKPSGLKPQLIGGDIVEEASAWGKSVYNGKLPHLVFSINSIEDIEFYGIKVEVSGSSIFKSLKEISNIIKGEDIVVIPLDLLASELYGMYKVALVYKQDIIWSEEFALVPNLQLEFDRYLYPPAEKGKRNFGKIILTSKYEFEVRGDEVIESSFHKNIVKFDTRYDSIEIILTYFLEEKEFNIKLTINIPKIYWRLRDGIEWSSEIGEIWYEDIGELEVKLPHFLQGIETKLVLSSTGAAIMPKKAKDNIVFNLRQLSDIIYDIREKGKKPVWDLILSFENNDITSFLLTRIRVHWEVVNLRIEQKRENDKRRVFIQWEDLGKVSDRIIRLWYLDDEAIEKIEKKICDGENEVEFVEDLERLPLGKYRLEFNIEDPWFDEKISLPEEGERNCFDIIIGDREEIIEVLQQKGLDIIEYEVDGSRVLLERYYWIQDIKVLISFVEGIEFEGYVCTFNDNGEVIELKYNPCKFYFGMNPDYFNRLPYLIDKDNDGFTYCRRCKVIFSETDGHKECGKEVILPEYIFVRIRRGENDKVRSD